MDKAVGLIALVAILLLPVLTVAIIGWRLRKKGIPDKEEDKSPWWSWRYPWM
ncbi:hypothetical protein ACFLXE_00370 [Chloroflexota bacterium]